MPVVNWAVKNVNHNNMEKAYEKLIAEHKLTIAELPTDAQTGIKSIKEIERAINMVEKKGKTPSAAVMAKVKSFDKWVVREILDYVEEKETNTPAPAVEAEVIIAEIKKEESPIVAEEKTEDPKGIEIDKELAAMLKEGKIEVSLDELKPLSPTGYDVIFSNYDKGGDNGLSTTNFLLTEQNDKFILTKK